MPPGWAYALAWLALALTYAGAFAFSGATPPLALRYAAATTAPNALLGLLTLRLTRRFFTKDPGRGLARAGLAAGCVSVAATAGWVLLVGADTWLRSGSPRPPPPNIVVWQSIINGLTHLTLAGTAYAWLGAARDRDAQERAHRAEALRVRAELQLLRAQLNPHFLLNTLHALLGLVRRQPAAAEAALERLGELLRFAMSVTQRGDDRVAFREEWALVTSYLELERLRLGDRLRVELAADAEAMDVPVPPFALQPLVENAVTHAIAPRASGGCLSVSARRDAGRLRIAVRDDGPGASQSALLTSPRSGLRLLRERLGVLYGGEARLWFDAAPGGGLQASLDLPEAGPGEAA